MSADDIDAEENENANDLPNDNESESLSTTSSSTNAHLNRQIHNLSAKIGHIPSNLTPPARGTLSRIQTNLHPFAASPSSPARYTSQTPPGIGKDLHHMPSLDLQDIQRRKNYSDPMETAHGFYQTSSISITRSRPLSIQKNKRKSKFNLDFPLASSFQVWCILH